MISLTSINTICSSSNWSQENKWLQKKGERAPPVPFSKFASAFHWNLEKRNYRAILSTALIFFPRTIRQLILKWLDYLLRLNLLKLPASLIMTVWTGCSLFSNGWDTFRGLIQDAASWNAMNGNFQFINPDRIITTNNKKRQWFKDLNLKDNCSLRLLLRTLTN